MNDIIKTFNAWQIQDIERLKEQRRKDEEKNVIVVGVCVFIFVSLIILAFILS